MKKRESENRHIIQLMQAFCLDYLDINFKLFVDGRQTINCPATDCIIKRAAQIWDHNFAKNLVLIQDTKTHKLEAHEFINPETGEIKKSGTIIYGAITNHQYYRYDRNNIFLFVNKRWVKNHEIQSALLKGYINVLPAARYPAAFIFVEIDACQIDVNTHPRKEEVKFLHPRIITNKLQEIVKSALQENLSSQIKQNVTFKTEPDKQPNFWSPYAKASEDMHFDANKNKEKLARSFEQFNFDTFLGEQNLEETAFGASEFLDPSLNSPLRQGFVGHTGRTEEKEKFYAFDVSNFESSEHFTKEFSESKINANGPDISKFEPEENKNYEFYPSTSSGQTAEKEIYDQKQNPVDYEDESTKIRALNYSEFLDPSLNPGRTDNKELEKIIEQEFTEKKVSQINIASQESINI
ncbi:MAG: DNA mismatch repair protein MutL, partial [uncultured bacterium]